jgi:phospholipase/carboxylesterase
MATRTVTTAATGAPLKSARGAAVLLHGRGASAESILALADELELDDVAYLAPEAPGHAWYPHSFLAPLAANEPYLSAALATVGAALSHLVGQGFSSDRVALIGFSQGGCLALEFVARNPRRYGAVAGLSAGLIGPPGTPRNYPGSLSGTPIFVGCSDVDGHIPLARVHESCAVLGNMDAVVTERIYPGLGHTVNDDEIAQVRKLLAAIAQARAA